jgi:hypothetical protein
MRRHLWAGLLLGCSDSGLDPIGAEVTFDSVLEVTPSGDIAFGEIPLGATAARTVTLHADGDTPLTIRRLHFGGETDDAFDADFPEMPMGIPPGGVREVELWFQPEDIGTFRGELLVFDGGRELSRRVLGFACDPPPGSQACD